MLSTNGLSAILRFAPQGSFVSKRHVCGIYSRKRNTCLFYMIQLEYDQSFLCPCCIFLFLFQFRNNLLHVYSLHLSNLKSHKT